MSVPQMVDVVTLTIASSGSMIFGTGTSSRPIFSDRGKPELSLCQPLLILFSERLLSFSYDTMLETIKADGLNAH